MAEDLQSLIVRLDDSATSAEVNEVREAAQSSGLTAEVSADWVKDSQSGNGAFWMVYIPISGTLTAFLTGFAHKAGQDAWDAFKSFVRKLRHARRSSRLASDGWVEIEDTDATKLMIGDLAEEAFDKLRDVDWAAHEGGQIMWNESAREWIDVAEGWRR